MTILEQLISAWNQFATENSYTEIIYPNESLEEIVKQIYGDELTPRNAVDLVRKCENGTYVEGHRWWWIQDDGNIGGSFSVYTLPIDFDLLNNWCIEKGMDTPWTEVDELESWTRVE